MQHIEAPPELN